MKDHDSNATDPLDPADPVNRESVSDGWGRAAAYDAYADGLHTYALGGLRHHEAAASAVYCAFVAADHHVAHLGDAEMLRPWLYAITRHFCRTGKLPRLRLTAATPPPAPKDAAMAELERTLLSAELASLDWPDTDGLSAAHREMLELSVRHGMESRAVGMMLGKPAAESFELLSEAWHELERSLAALALLRTSRAHCPDLAALAEGWSGRLTAQRREPLVAHVDTCSRCQYHLHKVVGAPQAPSILPHVPAPKELRERVLGDLLDSTPEKAARKAAIATRLSHFDAFGFPATQVPRTSAAPPRTATPTLPSAPVERRSRRLGALLAGRTSSAAAEAVAGEVATAPERLRTPATTPDPTTERSGPHGTAVIERRRTPADDEGPIAPRRGLAAAGSRAAGGDAARSVAADSAPEAPTDRGATSGGLAEELFSELAAEGRGGVFDRRGGRGDLTGDQAVGSDSDRGSAGSSLADALADFSDLLGDSPAASPASTLSLPDVSAGQSTEVLAALRAEDVAASFGRSPASDSSSEDTLVNIRRPGVFDDMRPVRGTPTRSRAARNSVAAAVEGRRRGVEDVRQGIVPVGDAYQAAAAVAAAVAAGDHTGAQVPPIAPKGYTHPASAVPEQRRRKTGVKSALASSAVLSGVGAAGVTAFVLFVPSSPGNNRALYTPPESGGNGAQTPDYPRPSSSSDAGPAVPVAGSLHSAGVPGSDVTAQVVAAVLPTTTSSTPGTPGTTTTATLPYNGPINLLPSQSDSSPSQDPSGNGQLHISVSQRSNNPCDVAVTLWNSGTAPLSWTATADASWLSLSAGSGMLAGGAQTTIHVLVDASAEPDGPWTAHVRFDPSGQMVSLHGNGGPSGPPSSGSSGSSPSSGPTSTPSTPSTTPSSSTPTGTPSSTPSGTPSTPHSSGPSTSGASDSGPSSSPSSSAPSSSPTTRPTSASSPPSTPSGTQPSKGRPKKPHR